MVLTVLTACGKNNDNTIVESIPEESDINMGKVYETGRLTPEDVIDAVVKTEYESNPALLISVLSEYDRNIIRGEHSEYSVVDIINIISNEITADKRNEYKFRRFLEEIVIDEVESINWDSEFIKSLKSDMETAGFDFLSVKEVCSIKYTVKYVLDGETGSCSASKYCAKIGEKWYLLYWDGSIYAK